MRVQVRPEHWCNAVKAKRPTRPQVLRRDIFDAARVTIESGEIDRDTVEGLLDFDETSLDAVTMESDGRVWVRLSFTSSVFLDLSDLRLPRQMEEEVVAKLNELRQAGRSGQRKSNRKVAS